MVKRVEVLLKSAVINFEIDKNKENKIKIEKTIYDLSFYDVRCTE